MPLHPRVHLDGIPLHIVQRGQNREPCFFGEEDYDTYLHWLAEALKETSCSLHAYALMTHHRANALGDFTPLLSPHPIYPALGAADSARREAYLSRPRLDPEAISDLRLALIP